MNALLRRLRRAILGSPPPAPKPPRLPKPPRVKAVRAKPAKRHGAMLPRHADDLPAPPTIVASPGVPQEVVELAACAVCGHAEATPVCEYNRFLLLPTAPDAAARRAGYALCHRCGVVCARIRPVGARFRYLLERFEETLGRDDDGGALGSNTLTAEAAAALRQRIAAGVFVTEYPPRKRRSYLPALFRDRMAVAPHVELIGSLVPLSSPRVLEIRPRFGALGAALRRLYGGQTAALPLFEVQQLFVREVYGTRADELLDYEHLRIPYDGPFDLVAANHLLTHAVRPAEALAAIRASLSPGGHLYLYNEPDEADLVESGKSIFNTLNAFHLQTFDAASLARALAVNGFEPIFIGHHLGNCVALARVAGPEGPALREDERPAGPEGPVLREDDGSAGSEGPALHMTEQERSRRLAQYAAARDRSVLTLPAELRGVFAEEWEGVLARGYQRQIVEDDADGRPRLVKA